MDITPTAADNVGDDHALEFVVKNLASAISRLCRQYAILQESDWGQAHQLDSFEHAVTLDMLGNPSAISRRGVCSSPNKIASYINTLRIEVNLVGKLLRQKPSTKERDSCTVRKPRPIDVMRQRVSELQNLVNRAADAKNDALGSDKTKRKKSSSPRSSLIFCETSTDSDAASNSSKKARDPATKALFQSVSTLSDELKQPLPKEKTSSANNELPNIDEMNEASDSNQSMTAKGFDEAVVQKRNMKHTTAYSGHLCLGDESSRSGSIPSDHGDQFITAHRTASLSDVSANPESNPCIRVTGLDTSSPETSPTSSVATTSTSNRGGKSSLPAGTDESRGSTVHKPMSRACSESESVHDDDNSANSRGVLERDGSVTVPHGRTRLISYKQLEKHSPPPTSMEVIDLAYSDEEEPGASAETALEIDLTGDDEKVDNCQYEMALYARIQSECRRKQLSNAAAQKRKRSTECESDDSDFLPTSTSLKTGVSSFPVKRCRNSEKKPAPIVRRKVPSVAKRMPKRRELVEELDGSDNDNMQARARPLQQPHVIANIPRPPATISDFHGICNAGSIKEGHGESIYCVSWSKDFHATSDDETFDTDASQAVVTARYLASCAGRYITLYQVNMIDDSVVGVKSGPFVVKQSYCDEDLNESFYACAFGGRCSPLNKDSLASYDTSTSSFSAPSLLMPQLLCAGGQRHRITVIDTARGERVRSLVGHGDEIWDLKACPTDEWLLLSASKDGSIRLWNLRNGSPIAMLGGHQGHREAVVSVGWHASGKRIVSGGFDTSVKIWDADEGSPLRNAIVQNQEAAMTLASGKVPFVAKPLQVEVPIFSTTNSLHYSVVDCVQFVGDLILSKSPTKHNSTLELWAPKIPATRNGKDYSPAGEFDHLRSFRYDNGGNIYFLRFSTDPFMQCLAAGSVDGKVYVWDFDAAVVAKKPLVCQTMESCTTVRYLDFSPCGNVLVGSFDDGSLRKWDVKRRSRTSDKRMKKTTSSTPE